MVSPHTFKLREGSRTWRPRPSRKYTFRSGTSRTDIVPFLRTQSGKRAGLDRDRGSQRRETYSNTQASGDTETQRQPKFTTTDSYQRHLRSRWKLRRGVEDRGRQRALAAREREPAALELAGIGRFGYTERVRGPPGRRRSWWRTPFRQT